MINNITIDTTNVHTINVGLSKFKTALTKQLPNLHGRSFILIDTNLDAPISAFLSTMAQLERFFFKEKLQTFNTRTVITKYPRTYQNVMDDINICAVKSGFIYINLPRTKYVEIEAAKHLTAAEASFKVESHHFLKIFTLRNNLVIFSNKPLPFQTIVKLKMLQWSISNDKIETPQQDVLNFLTGFKEPLDKDVINNALHNILSLDIFQEIKYNELKELFKPNYTRKIRRMEDDLANYESSYISYTNQLAELATKIRELHEQLLITNELANQETDNTELIKYLFKHPYITDIEKIDSHQVYIKFRAPILYFDDSIIKRIIRNYSETKATLLKVFLDNKYELITQCQMRFDTDTFNIRLNYIGNSDVIGHPHIDQYNCFGNHMMAIQDAAKEGNYFGAIEQMAQAALNMNFADSVVLNYLLRALIEHSSLPTWRSKETGIMLSTKEILEVYAE